MFQSLESRRLLAASVADDTLTVTGTAGDDRIRILRGADEVIVTINGHRQMFAAADFHQVIVNGRRGNDRVSVEVSLLVPALNSGGIGPPVSLIGAGGNDTLLSGSGDDTLDGGSGADYLDAGPGINTLRGGDGDDTLIAAGAAADDFSGGNGTDTIDYSSSPYLGGVHVTLDDVANDGHTIPLILDTAASLVIDPPGTPPISIPGIEEGDNVHSDIETVVGTKHGDSIAGDDADNRLVGAGGNDTLIGSGGNDTLIGGSGKDLLDGGDDADQIFGGRGSDTVDYSSRTARVSVNLQDGLAGDGSFDVNTATTEGDNVHDDVENILGTPGDDILVGTDAGNTCIGFGGDDQMTGNGGADLLIGGDGNDSFLPGDFNNGDDAVDVIRGGAGTDTVSSAAAADVVDADIEKAFYRGHLRSAGHIGGDGTDWIMDLPSGPALGSVDIDVTTNGLLSTAQANDGGFVWINGHFETRHFTARGAVRVMVAESIEAVIE